MAQQTMPGISQDKFRAIQPRDSTILD